jgi:uncharacterized membrane protein
MGFATVMWFNVWFVIWPAQKRILGGKVAGDELAATRKRALAASRMNTFFSAPMLFGMVAPQNYAAVNPLTLVVVIAFGFFAVWAAYAASAKVGQSV